MSCAEDWSNTRRLRGKKATVPIREKPKGQYYFRCQDCGRLVPIETRGLLCSECAEVRRNGAAVDNPMELFMETLRR